MFLSLIAVTFSISLAVCFILAKLFGGLIDAILKRIVADDIAMPGQDIYSLPFTSSEFQVVFVSIPWKDF